MKKIIGATFSAIRLFATFVLLLLTVLTTVFLPATIVGSEIFVVTGSMPLAIIDSVMIAFVLLVLTNAIIKPLVMFILPD